MEIVGIRIENFKSFGENDNYIGNLSNMNIFIGKNNSGKSTIMQVLELIFHKSESRISPQLKRELIKRSTRRGKEAKVFLDVKLSDGELKKFFPDGSSSDLLGYFSELRKKLINMVFTVEIQIKDLISDKKVSTFFTKEIKTEKLEKNKIIEINQHLSPKNFQSILDKHNLIFFPAIRMVKEESGDVKGIRLEPSGNRLTLNVEFILTNHDQDEQIIEETLRDKIKDFFPEMGNFTIAVQNVGGLRHIFFKRIPLSGYGTGVMDIFLFLANIIIRETLNENINFICIEEPENNLHLSLQKRLLNLLRDLSKKDKQIFISTHSPYFIEPDDIENLYRLSLEEEKSKVSWTDHKIIDELKRSDLLKMIRPNNIGVFFSDKVILVEGIQDELFLSHVANEMYKTTRDTSFLQCGGEGELAKFKRLFDNFGIETYIICDSHCIDDKGILSLANEGKPIREEDDEDVKIDKLKENGVFILRRKGIEEYYDPSIKGGKMMKCLRAIEQMDFKNIKSNSKLDGSEESEFETIFNQIFLGNDSD